MKPETRRHIQRPPFCVLSVTGSARRNCSVVHAGHQCHHSHSQSLFIHSIHGHIKLGYYRKYSVVQISHYSELLCVLFIMEPTSRFSEILSVFPAASRARIEEAVPLEYENVAQLRAVVRGRNIDQATALLKEELSLSKLDASALAGVLLVSSGIHYTDI